MKKIRLLKFRIKDFIFKLRCLLSDFYFVIPRWKKFVWDVELDSYFCCNGRECGCYATTQREQLDYEYKNRDKELLR